MGTPDAVAGGSCGAAADARAPRAVMVSVLWSLPAAGGAAAVQPRRLRLRRPGPPGGQRHRPLHYGPGDFAPTRPVGDARRRHLAVLPSPYGPVWLWLSGMVVLLSHDHLVPACIMLRLLAVAGLVLVAWALPRLARAHDVPPQRALWLGPGQPLRATHSVGRSPQRHPHDRSAHRRPGGRRTDPEHAAARGRAPC